MSQIYSVSQFGKMIGIKTKTLQKWDRDGVLRAYRTPTNRRYYTHEQYLEYLGQTKPTPAVDVIYVRVSSRNQKDDMVNQLTFLKEWCARNGISIANIYSDIASGMNFRRQQWNRLIDDCIEGKIGTIYVSHRDRFVRFGFDWFQDFLLRHYNVKLIPIDDVINSPEQEMIQDLITIVHVFSCRIYGLRKYKKRLAAEFGDEYANREENCS